MKSARVDEEYARLLLIWTTRDDGLNSPLTAWWYTTRGEEDWYPVISPMLHENTTLDDVIHVMRHAGQLAE